ncbi:MarR family transcriptional regulator [Glycomyces sp. NPDC048151]|uniref:MarR family transcriptional regulator n=1 Tax=Glycomyces sp. NPDC048151 TaxID=3364002 RepID=UPI00371DC5AC
MSKQRPAGLTSTLAFQLGILGTTVTELYAAKIAALGLKPKHAGLLALLADGAASSQAEAAETMGVAPSFMVGLADRLQEIGAVTRQRDPRDRRRQVLAPTEEGIALLKACNAIAEAIDADLTADLKPGDAEALRRSLATMTGFPRSADR